MKRLYAVLGGAIVLSPLAILVYQDAMEQQTRAKQEAFAAYVNEHIPEICVSDSSRGCRRDPVDLGMTVTLDAKPVEHRIDGQTMFYAGRGMYLGPARVCATEYDARKISFDYYNQTHLASVP